MLPSAQTLPSKATEVCMQLPSAIAQLSVVQPLPSSQLGAPVAAHAPPEHLSPVVQGLPSLHAAVLLGAWLHPLSAAQLAVVQGLPSSQFRSPDLVHTPAKHLSPVVHRLPSSQVAPAAAAVWAHPLVVLQLSTVHARPSLQSSVVVWMQLPPLQMSPVVHALLSEQVAVLSAVVVQPLWLLHALAVHGWPSSQFSAGPGTH